MTNVEGLTTHRVIAGHVTGHRIHLVDEEEDVEEEEAAEMASEEDNHVRMIKIIGNGRVIAPTPPKNSHSRTRMISTRSRFQKD